MNRSVMITVAPNGARRQKRDHHAIPLSIDEIVADAMACERAGAAILHLHVREPDGGHSLDVGRYRETIEAIGEACDLVIQPTTERVGRFTPDDMMRVQRALAPETITFNLQELIDPEDDAQTARVRDFLGDAAAAGTVPQYIVYNPDQLKALARWWEAGWLPQAQPCVLLVLGRYAGSLSQPADIGVFLKHLPENWLWGVCAFGAQELACVVQAALSGGHCRVGFENNLTRADGHSLADNAEQVGLLTRVLGDLGFAVASPAQVRQTLGCRPRVRS